MPAVNNVGEPCAGEPHARFDGRGLETGHITCHRASPRPSMRFLICVVELVGVVDVPKPLGGYGGGPGGASGSRFSVGPWLVGRGVMPVGQPGAGIAAILVNAVTIAVAHGQLAGIRSRRRRPPVVSSAGTCRSR
jgi:hypothetical protein